MITKTATTIDPWTIVLYVALAILALFVALIIIYIFNQCILGTTLRRAGELKEPIITKPLLPPIATTATKPSSITNTPFIDSNTATTLTNTESVKFLQNYKEVK